MGHSIPFGGLNTVWALSRGDGDKLERTVVDLLTFVFMSYISRVRIVLAETSLQRPFHPLFPYPDKPLKADRDIFVPPPILLSLFLGDIIIDSRDQTISYSIRYASPHLFESH
jgi:hypothetical protein